jgi:hypothetical protein
MSFLVTLVSANPCPYGGAAPNASNPGLASLAGEPGCNSV